MRTELAKAITVWSSLIGSIFFWGGFLVFSIYDLFSEDKGWIYPLLQDKPQVALFIPLAALASFCNVLILKITDGPIEFEAFTIKFSGAAGPMIMWVMSFLSLCFGITMLWNM